MSQPSTTELLNQLLAIHCRSFPQYLRYARPYVKPGSDAVVETLDDIVANQDGLAERIGQMIVDQEALPRSGDFPMEFTDSHDLELDYLIQMAIDYQEQDVAAITALVGQSQSSPAAKSLAEEALGMAKGHLESLRELLPDAANAQTEA